MHAIRQLWTEKAEEKAKRREEKKKKGRRRKERMCCVHMAPSHLRERRTTPRAPFSSSRLACLISYVCVLISILNAVHVSSHASFCLRHEKYVRLWQRHCIA